METTHLNKITKIWLAPMEGVVDPVIRKLYSQLGGFDYMVTEFVRVTDKINPPKVFLKYSPELNNKSLTDSGTPVFVQLLGGQPGPMQDNAEAVVNMGACGIDINFGCPAKTVNRHDGGAALLKNPERVHKITSAIRCVVPKHLPVSAKVRLGFEDKSLCQDIAQAASDAQASWITIHARTKTEGYKPPAHWEFIAKMKEVCSIPVIANGDIWTPADYKRCFEVTGCPSVALGRGAMADPFLALKIKDQNFTKSPEDQWLEIESHWLPLFLNLSITHKSEHYALVRAKQWLKLLSRNFKQAGLLFEKIKRCKELSDAYPFFNTNLLLSLNPSIEKPNSSEINPKVL